MKLEDHHQGHGGGAGSSWKFWRRFSIRSRGHEFGRSKANRDLLESGHIAKSDIGEARDFARRTQCLPDVVVEGTHHLPVFNANAIPPPKPPRLFLPKSPSGSSRSSSTESVFEDRDNGNHFSGNEKVNQNNNKNHLTNNNNNNNNDTNSFWLLNSGDFSQETREALYASSSRLNNNYNNNVLKNYASTSATAAVKPRLFYVAEEEVAEASCVNETSVNIEPPSVSSLRLTTTATTTNPSTPATSMNDKTTENDGNSREPKSSTPPPLPPRSSPPSRSRTTSTTRANYNQYHTHNHNNNNLYYHHSGTTPRKPKIVTPDLSQKRYRRHRIRKLSSCDDQVSRQWRIMTSVLDLMCQRLDPYPLLDPLKRAGVLTNVHLQSFLGHRDRRSVCEGLVDIIGKGTPKCLSVFCAAIGACPGNSTEILEILQTMREIDRLVYDLPEVKGVVEGANESNNSNNNSDTDNDSSENNAEEKDTLSPTTASTAVATVTAATGMVEDKGLTFDIGYLSTDYSLKPLVELDRIRSNSSGSRSNSGSSGSGNPYQSQTCSRNSSFSMLDAALGSTTTLDQAVFAGGGEHSSYPGLVMMSISIIGHSLAGERCQALVEVIRNHNCISELHLGKTGLSGQEVSCLTETIAKNSSTIHTLDLRLNIIDEAGASAICQLLRLTRFLRVLNLSSTELASQSFQQVASAVSGNKSLVELDGSFLDISDECCAGLRDMLRVNTSLQKLRLRGNNLAPVGCRTLCEGLARNIGLSVLDLSRNPIGDIGVEALAKYLPNSHVTEVYIDGCGITSGGGQALSEMVSCCKRLKHLDVSTNELGDAGVTKMAPALERTSSLMTVSLNMCSITNDGFAKVLDAMEKNTSIHRLKLCYNKLGDQHTTPTATSDNLRHRLRIVLSSRPKLKVILWGNALEEDP